MFELHPRLSADCIPVRDLELCSLLMMNDSNYPWFILVPRVNDVREAFELSASQQITLSKESNHLSHSMMRAFKCTKMNVAALGNQVPQLHVHHIARFEHDAAWPKPVWGNAPTVPYENGAENSVIERLLASL